MFSNIVNWKRAEYFFSTENKNSNKRDRQTISGVASEAIWRSGGNQRITKLKIEDNIKENEENIKKNRFNNTYLDLVKLFVENNRGLFWIENSAYSTIYYIKLKSENI